MTEKIIHVCVPLLVSDLAALKEATKTQISKDAVSDAIEFRIAAGKTKAEMS